MADIPATLAADPTTLAWLRASGVENATDEANTNNRIAAINRTLGINLDDLHRQGEQARSGISASFEDRGLFRSGMHEENLGRSMGAEQRQALDLRAGAADDTASLLSQLAMNRASRARSGAETSLEALARLIQGNLI